MLNRSVKTKNWAVNNHTSIVKDPSAQMILLQLSEKSNQAKVMVYQEIAAAELVTMGL